MFQRSSRILVTSFALFVGACASEKPAVDEDFSDLGQLDQKSDAFSYRLKLVSELSPGESKNFLYTTSPRFRGFGFAGQESQALDIWITGSRGDAVTWLLDSKFHVVAKNDDADDATLNSHIAVTLPADDRYYIVMRDYNLERHRFNVGLSFQKPVRPIVVPADSTGNVLDCTAIGDAAGEECGGLGYSEDVCLSAYLADHDATSCTEDVWGRLYDDT